jgi:integrase
MPRRRTLAGLRLKRGKWQARVEIGGKEYTKTFPRDEPIATMRQWREDQIDAHGTEELPPGAKGSFGADVALYLTRITAMPTYKQKAAHLALWVQALGRDRPRRSITAAEIDAVLQRWLVTPTVPPPGKKHGGRPSGPDGLAPGTVRKRRRTLQSLWVKLDGKPAPNPVKGSTNPKEAKAETRGLNYVAIARALAAMPDYCSVKPGAVKPLSRAKLCAHVVAYTGLPPGILNAVARHDLSLVDATVRVVPRTKGGGVEARTLPLTAEGLAAFQAFHRANAYGRVPKNLNASFKRGCQRAGLDPKAVRLYDLRHSFLSQVYRATRDLATVARLGVHAEGSVVTARYARGANAEVDLAAVAAFDTTLEQQRRQALSAAADLPPAADFRPADPARRPKRRVRKPLRKAV